MGSNSNLSCMVSAEGLSYEGPEASASLAFVTYNYKKDVQCSFFLVVKNQENLNGHQHSSDWNVDVHIIGPLQVIGEIS